MGWPRKNDGARLYREKCGAYMLVIMDAKDYRGSMDAIVNVYNYKAGDSPRLASSGVSREYLAATWPKRVQWDELPDDWRKAFMMWIEDWTEKPESIRGFWRIGCQPKPIREVPNCNGLKCTRCDAPSTTEIRTDFGPESVCESCKVRLTNRGNHAEETILH